MTPAGSRPPGASQGRAQRPVQSSGRHQGQRPARHPGQGQRPTQPQDRRRIRKGPIVAIAAIVVACVVGIGLLIGLIAAPADSSLPLAVQDGQPGLVRYTYNPDDPEAESPFTTGPTSVSLSAVGDNLMHLPVIETADLAEGSLGDGEYDFGVIYSGLADIIETHDINFIDIETPMGGDELGFSGYPIFNTPSDDAADIAEAGFNLATTATNHAWDQGFDGIKSMSRTWSEHPEVVVAGTYTNQSDRDNIRTFSKNGLTFAFLAYQDSLNGFTLPSKQKFAVADSNDVKQVRKDIQRAHELAEVVIVAMSWGAENSFEPNASQQKTAQLFADEGVDLVIGFGPHVIQPVEWVTAGETPVTDDEDAGTTGDAAADASTQDDADATAADGADAQTQDDDAKTSDDGNAQSQADGDEAAEDGGEPHKTLVVYSLGNYVSNQPSAQNLVEGCFTCNFVRDEEGAVSIADPTWIPLVGHFVAGGSNYGTTGHNAYPLYDYTESMARQNYHLGSLSDPLGYVRDLTLDVIDPEVVTIDFGSDADTTRSASSDDDSSSDTTETSGSGPSNADPSTSGTSGSGSSKASGTSGAATTPDDGSMTVQ